VIGAEDASLIESTTVQSSSLSCFPRILAKKLTLVSISPNVAMASDERKSLTCFCLVAHGEVDEAVDEEQLVA
jgi:hypothetical protein